MAEYIDKDALLKDLFDNYNCADIERWSADYTMGFERAMDIVSKALPLNVAIVKHGRWIEDQWIDYDLYLKCSKCGVMVMDAFFDDIGDWNYCPNCGARMEDGAADNETD